MKISMISACAINTGYIGVNNKIPWHIPSDLKFFREYTKNKIVVMGRLTFESLPVFLTGRLSVILSSNPDLIQKRVDVLKAKGLVVSPILIMEDIDRFFDSIDAINESYTFDQDEIVIIGGESVYRDFMPICDKIVLSIVNCTVLGDKIFPDYSRYSFEDSEVLKDIQEEGDEYSYARMTMKRKSSNVVNFPDGNVLSKGELYKRLNRK